MHKSTDSVRVVIFDSANLRRFLIVTESDDEGNWKLPGGSFNKLEQGVESPEAAATRELLEEVGLEAEGLGLRQAERLVNDDGVSARYIFAVIVNTGLIQPTAEIAEHRWTTREELPDCPNRNHILTAHDAAAAVLIQELSLPPVQ
jgi:ADP-ribose pyrophosphatase YjhB (NUDIX family)